MSKFKRYIFFGIVGVVLILAFSLHVAPATHPEVGYTAPDFTLQTLSGKTVTLSDLRGKPVYLNFWASWCPPCQAEIPEIEKFYQTYNPNVTVLAVNLTTQDKMTDIENIINQDKVTFPVLLDRSNTSSVADLYQVDGIPASFFIDKNGIIRDQVVGGMTYAMMQTSIGKTNY